MRGTAGALILLLVAVACAPPPTAQTADKGRLDGVVFNAHDFEPINEARLRMFELHAVGAGEDRYERSAPDGHYEFHDLPAASYRLSCTKDGYKAYDRRVQLAASARRTVDIALVDARSVSPEPFEDGTLRSLFDLATPLSPIESTQVKVTVFEAQTVSVNVPELERQVIVLTLAITNVSDSSLYLSLADSHVLGQTAEGLLEWSYDVLYTFDDVASQFLPDRFPTGLPRIGGGETVAGKVAFSDPEAFTVPTDLENVTPMLCFAWEARASLEPQEFCTYYPGLRSPYLRP